MRMAVAVTVGLCKEWPKVVPLSLSRALLRYWQDLRHDVNAGAPPTAVDDESAVADLVSQLALAGVLRPATLLRPLRATSPAQGRFVCVLLLRLERAFGRAALRQELWAEEESSPGSSLRSFAPGAQTSEQLQSNCSPEQSPLEGSGGSCQAQASNEEQLHAPGTDKESLVEEPGELMAESGQAQREPDSESRMRREDELAVGSASEDVGDNLADHGSSCSRRQPVAAADSEAEKRGTEEDEDEIGIFPLDGHPANVMFVRRLFESCGLDWLCGHESFSTLAMLSDSEDC
ncbi:unnamed protein product [Polarella glacialis]|uniref:Uncharacterized protein n=1 Tax=Polarella glacialis TaxID=89957 RepID=A0A813EDR5_POLGL|nr:unnamed protein product [Polarella glacialis]